MNKQLVSALLCLASGLIGLAIAQSSFAQTNSKGLLDLCLSTGLSPEECADMGFVVDNQDIVRAQGTAPNVVIVEIDETDADSTDTVMTVESTEDSTVVTLSPGSENLVVRIFASGQNTINAAMENCEAAGLSDQECGVFYREVFRGACEAGELSGVLCDGHNEDAIVMVEGDTEASAEVSAVVVSETTVTIIEETDGETSTEVMVVETVETPLEEAPAEEPVVVEMAEPTTISEFSTFCGDQGVSVVACYFDNQAAVSAMCQAQGIRGVTECISALTRGR